MAATWDDQVPFDNPDQVKNIVENLYKLTNPTPFPSNNGTDIQHAIEKAITDATVKTPLAAIKDAANHALVFPDHAAFAAQAVMYFKANEQNVWLPSDLNEVLMDMLMNNYDPTAGGDTPTEKGKLRNVLKGFLGGDNMDDTTYGAFATALKAKIEDLKTHMSGTQRDFGITFADYIDTAGAGNAAWKALDPLKVPTAEQTKFTEALKKMSPVANTDALLVQVNTYMKKEVSDTATVEAVKPDTDIVTALKGAPLLAEFDRVTAGVAEAEGKDALRSILAAFMHADILKEVSAKVLKADISTKSLFATLNGDHPEAVTYFKTLDTAE